MSAQELFTLRLALDVPLRLRMISSAPFPMLLLEVFLAEAFMLFLLSAIFGVALSTASSASSGVLMREIEKRPVTVGVVGEWSAGDLAAFGWALAGEGDFLP